jgi:hypothetical protein
VSREGPRLAILDYGMGNLRSVEKALERIGAEGEITADPDRAASAEGVILPGVGAFPKAIARVRELGHDQLIAERADQGRPVLGICLGMQLLFSSSIENERAEGIGVLPGPVEPLAADGLKVPHIGWSAGPIPLSSPGGSGPSHPSTSSTATRRGRASSPTSSAPPHTASDSRARSSARPCTGSSSTPRSRARRG